MGCFSELGFKMASLTFIYTLLSGNIMFSKGIAVDAGKCSLPVYLGRGNGVVNTSIVLPHMWTGQNM